MRGGGVHRIQPSGRLVLVGLAVFAFEAAAQNPPSIVGALTDLATGDPVPSATVILNRVAVTTTDANGAFWFRGVQTGTHLIEIRRLGYAPKARQLYVPPDSSLIVSVPLRPLATRLDDVMVTGTTSTRRDLSTFRDRRRLGRGHFVTRAEFEERKPFLFTDVVRRFPGVRAINGPFGHKDVVFSNGCSTPRIVIDGLVLDVGAIPGLKGPGLVIDNLVSLVHVEAIEVYTRDAEVPAEYFTPGAGCGAIVIWTR